MAIFNKISHWKHAVVYGVNLGVCGRLWLVYDEIFVENWHTLCLGRQGHRKNIPFLEIGKSVGTL